MEAYSRVCSAQGRNYSMLASDFFIIALDMTHSRIEPRAVEPGEAVMGLRTAGREREPFQDTRHEDDEQTGLAPKRTVDRS